MIIETVEDLIEELKRRDPKARIGVSVKTTSYGDPRTYKSERLQVQDDHSESRVGVRIVGEQ